MLNIGSMNISSTSRIDGRDVVHFNSVIGLAEGNKNYTTTKSVTDLEAYRENQTQCNADYAEFEEKTVEIMENIAVL